MSYDDAQQLVRLARSQGWDVAKTKGQHWCFRSPAGEVVIMSGTPRGGNRAIENAKAQMRRRGLDIPRGGR